MNRLPPDRQAQVAQLLVEGTSIRATSRITGVAKATILKLLIDLGGACADYQDAVLRDLPCRRLQCDEIWTFVGAKERNVPLSDRGVLGRGDAWVWAAVCRDTKLVPSWLVGKRSPEFAMAFVADLASRMAGRVQITTDGLAHYLHAVPWGFGKREVDFAQLVKIYGSPTTEERRRYSPAACLGTKRTVILGNVAEREISTSHIERQNLTLRMSSRRFTRLTNAYSKKVTNLDAAVALHYAYYNFVRPHGSLSGRTPAMAAGLARLPWDFSDLVALLEAERYSEPIAVRPVRPRD